MSIGGFQKQSFIDWEEKTAAVIFTNGCNFRCGYCHNPSLVLPQLRDKTNDLNEIEIFDYLKSRKNWLDGVVVTGGEPTIHNDLEDFLTKIKKIGYEIKLDTNGSNPKLLTQLINKKLIDFIAMDIKTLLQKEKYLEITKSKIPNLIYKINKSIAIIRNSNIKYQFRTTVTPNYHTNETIKLLKKMFKFENYKIQPFKDGEIIDKFNHL